MTNQLTTIIKKYNLAYPAALPSEIYDVVAILQDAFPEQTRSAQGAENRLKAYVIALDGIPAKAISRAVTKFIQGKADHPAHQKGWMPKCDIMADVAWQEWYGLRREWTKANVPDPDPDPDPEKLLSRTQRKRMKGKFEKLKKDLAKSKLKQSAKKEN